MLTDTKLRNLKPKEKLYKVNDRDGLYVAVTTAGSISFRYNYGEASGPYVRHSLK
ncbi:Arm DNA-binding domain-containing protein [Pseudomonas sp. TH41]|uniref:Arm DNA-binding domain-containing protein n=1 Tax=Pseudomonas sp. TH41 TaxID=2796405 RepID=UPI00237A0CBC|nr:Arm DNA-binding domain-containing protein [Pseudomonas sp. TH41]